MQVEFARRRQPGAAAYGPREYENIFLRIESQELSIRRIMSEEVARSELEQMERDARYALFGQHHELQIAVREYQRQAIQAVSQAVHELSESYEAMMMQEFQGIQDRYEGRMEENERRVAQVIGSEAREAFTCSEKPHVTGASSPLPKREKKELLKRQMHSKLRQT